MKGCSVRKIASAIQSSQGRSRPWSGALLINAFAEMAEGDKADQFAVMAIPGLVPFADLGSSPVRGLHRMGDTLYAVSGTTLYSVAEDGTSSSLGTIGGSLPVMMADNGAELAIQGGALNNEGYVLSGGTLYSSITNLPPVSNVVYIDGYFVWSVFESDQFIISGINDGLTYDPLDVATVEGDPDDIIAVVNDHRELQFYGSRTVEIWYNSGAADFPFARQGNAFIERGCIDRNSLVKIDNSVHFVGDDRVVYRLNGYEPVRISTHAIEFRISDAEWFRGFTYTQQGHKFYVLNTDAGCWAYDMATGAWAQRRSLAQINYRGANGAVAYGTPLIGSAYNGKIYLPDLDVNDEDGEVIPVEIQIPSLQTNRLRSTLYAFEAQIQAGVGNSSDADPQIILQYSKDGGNTYSAELSRTMGAVGGYLTRCIWRLGVSFRQLQIRLKLPAKVQRFIIAYYADVR
jgi:hypothetical protein